MHHSDTEPKLPLEGLTRALKTHFKNRRSATSAKKRPIHGSKLDCQCPWDRFIGQGPEPTHRTLTPYRFHQLAEVSNRLGELNAMFSPLSIEWAKSFGISPFREIAFMWRAHRVFLLC